MLPLFHQTCQILELLAIFYRDRAAAQVIRLRGLELAQYPGTLGIGAIFKKIRFCCQDET